MEKPLFNIFVNMPTVADLNNLLKKYCNEVPIMV